MPTLLTGDAGPVATIGYWSGGEPVAPFAAAELQSYLKNITESELPLEAVETTAAGDAAADTHADSGVASAVVPERGETAFPGETEFSLSTQLEPVADWLAGELDDAFTPYMDDVVVLAGTTHRGTLYTVYALLERLGLFFAPDFGFYDGHHEHVPDCETLDTPDLDTVEAPDLDYRRRAIECGWSVIAETLTAPVD